MLQVKRVYDKPEKSDGKRILVDRLWPRGISKERALVDGWLKIVTPTNELRNWYHEDKEKRYPEFKKSYLAELKKSKKEILVELPKSKNWTLITGVKDIEHSHIPTLKKFLEDVI